MTWIALKINDKWWKVPARKRRGKRVELYDVPWSCRLAAMATEVVDMSTGRVLKSRREGTAISSSDYANAPQLSLWKMEKITGWAQPTGEK